MDDDNRILWVFGGLLLALLAALLIIMQVLFDVPVSYTLVVVAVGGALLGTISGTLGAFAVLRQQSLLGDTLSHAALPGVAVGFLLFGRELGALLIGAAVAGWLAVQLIRAITTTTRLKQDAAMGMVLATFFALGIALISYIQSRNDASQAGLDSFIFGQAAAIRQNDILIIGITGAVALFVLLLMWKEFKLITFDADYARASGFPVTLIDTVLSSLIVVAIVLGLQLAGVILMVGLLIAPGVAARQWTNRLGHTMILAGAIGAFSGASGAILSSLRAGLPTGPLIIVVGSLIVAISLLFAPQRGIVWSWRQTRRDERRFATQHVLMDIFNHAQQHHDMHAAAPESLLRNLRGSAALTGIKRLEDQHLIHAENGSWALTPGGVNRAEEIVRNHTLWDLYRQFGEELNLSRINEDRSARIDDMLPADEVQQLEALDEKDV